MAQGVHRFDNVFARGNGTQSLVVPFSKISVCVAGTGCAQLQNIYTDLAMTNRSQNPVTADANGFFSYYYAPGCVDERQTSINQGTHTIINVCSGGGGAGCTASGVAGILQASNGSGGCEAVDAAYDPVGGFTFGDEIGTPTPKPVQFNVQGNFSVVNTGGTDLRSQTGLSISDGLAGVGGSISIVEQNAGGIHIIDKGESILIHEDGSTISPFPDGAGVDIYASGGFGILSEMHGLSANPQDTGFNITNKTVPPTLPTPSLGTYGINITDITTDGIFIDEQGTGQISLAANDINMSTLTPGQFKANGSQICTMSTGCGGGGGTVTSVGITVPSWLTAGSAVISSGVVPITSTTGEPANQFIATPDGTSGAIGLRAIVASDIPTLNQNTLGSAATASAASGTPTLCGAGLAPRGVLPNWNATGCTALFVPLKGVTGTITGTALTAACDSGTATVTGATVGSVVSVSSTTGVDVGAAFDLRASVTAANTVTVYVCGTGTPASLAYNIAVIQ
jgi:hypothetical protein